MRGGKGKASEGTKAFDAKFWEDGGPEQRIAAVFELRRLYYEVMHPGTGAKSLDRSVGGTRRLRD
jgi:hypothetical protein